MSHTWVKVCGLTVRADVDHAVAAGADAIGVVTYAGSPRFVPPDEVGPLISGLPVLTVVLTVDTPADEVLAVADNAGAGAIQPYGLHAAEATQAALATGLVVLRPVRAVPGFRLPDEPGAIPLIDTPHEALHGGTGETFDWELVRHVDRRFVLAGGLGPANVAEAVRLARPWGVDASSALESNPGKKDPGKVTAFIEEARRQ